MVSIVGKMHGSYFISEIETTSLQGTLVAAPC